MLLIDLIPAAYILFFIFFVRKVDVSISTLHIMCVSKQKRWQQLKDLIQTYEPNAFYSVEELNYTSLLKRIYNRWETGNFHPDVKVEKANTEHDTINLIKKKTNVLRFKKNPIPHFYNLCIFTCDVNGSE